MKPVPPFFLIIILCVTLCIGLAGAGMMIFRMTGGAAPEEPREAIAAGISSPSPTATGTPSPIPTIDYSAAWPMETQAAAAADLAQAQDRIARAASTIAAATSISIDNAGRAGTPTAIAMMTAQAAGTEQARATTEAGNRAAYFAGVAATAARQADTARRKANRDDALFYAVCIVVGGAVLVIVWAAAYRMNLNAWRSVAGDAADSLLDNLQPPAGQERAFIQVVAGQSHTSRLPVDDATFAEWARRMLAGETAGINKWEGANSPFYGKRDAYIPFLDEMERRGYIAEIPGRGKILSEIGRRFCIGWLARKGLTAPPLAPKAAENAENAMIHTMPCPQNTPAEGEGTKHDTEIEYDGDTPVLPPKSSKIIRMRRENEA